MTIRLFLCVVLSSTWIDAAEVDLSEVIAGWEQQKAILRHVQVTCQVVRYKSNSDEPSENATHVFRSSGSRMRLDTVTADGLTSTVIGSDYFFAVDKATKAKDYSLRVLDVNERIETALNGEVSSYRDRILEYFFCPFYVGEMEAQRYFASEGMKLKSLERTSDGLALLTYDFKYDEKILREIGLQPYTSVGAKMKLDPGNNWRILSYEIPTSTGKRYATVTYDTNGFPKFYTHVFDLTGYKETIECTYKDWREYVANPQDFSLTGFGLPEPDLDALRRGPQLMSGRGLFAGAMLAVIGVVIWVMARKREASKTEAN